MLSDVASVSSNADSDENGSRSEEGLASANIEVVLSADLVVEDGERRRRVGRSDGFSTSGFAFLPGSMVITSSS